ncbi:unnamed protein product, partial [Rotaria magnacalcarata]
MQFIIIQNPYNENSSNCTLDFLAITKFDHEKRDSGLMMIYGLAIANEDNVKDYLVFAYVGEDWQNNVYLMLTYLIKSDNTSLCPRFLGSSKTKALIDSWEWMERPLLTIDPLGTRAYAFGWGAILSMDITSISNMSSSSTYVEATVEEYPFQRGFFPKAFAVIRKQIIFVVGILKIDRYFRPHLFAIKLN